MADTTVFNLPGQQNGAGSTEALFLTMFGGEVMNSFNETNIARPLVRSISVGAGKDFQFPRIGKAEATYHDRGRNILEGTDFLQSMEHTAVSIAVDKTLLSSTFVDDWDEAIKHYETRSEYARQLGSALARTTDIQLLRMIAKAADGTPFVDQINTDAMSGSTVTLDGTSGLDTIKDGVIKAAVELAKKDVPMADMVVAVSPDDYYALLEDDQLVSADFSSASNADRGDGKIFKAYGFRIVTTPRLSEAGIGAGTYAPLAGENNPYDGDFSQIRALAWHRDAVGSIVRKDVAVETDYRVERQGTLVVAKMLAGHGVLKNECAVRIVDSRWV